MSCEQIANLSYKKWMNINANFIGAKQLNSGLITTKGTLALTTEDGDVSITARSLLLNGSPIVPGTGSGLNWKGDFNIATNYLVDDAVSYQGSSYICIQNSVGNYPDNYAYWNLMAQQGGQGPVGAQGQTGQQGPQGLSSSFFNYRINTDPFDGNTQSGYLQFDNANDPGTQRMYINFIDSLGNDITPFLGFLNEGDQIVIQLQSDSTQNQIYLVNGSPVNAPDWLAVPITFGSSTVEFSQDDQVLLIINLVGAQGPAGQAATINVNTTTTLPSGSSATVVNVGSISAALLDFGIPAGPAGPPGPPGPGGGNFSTPSDQSLDMNFHAISNATSVNLVDGPYFLNLISNTNGNGYSSMTMNNDFAFVSQASMRFKSEGPFQIGSGGVNKIRVLQDESQLYQLPNTKPNYGQIMIARNEASPGGPIDLQFENIPAPVLPGPLTYYTSPNGLDTNNGSILAPYQTISYALAQINLIPDSTPVVLTILEGIYNESPTITRNNTFITTNNVAGNSTLIVGDLTFSIPNITTVKSSLIGLTVNGSIVFNDSGIGTYDYLLGNVSVNAVNGPCINNTTVSTLAYSIVLNQCTLQVSGSSNSCITNAIGRMSVLNSNLSQILTNNTSPLIVVNNGAISMSNTIVISGNSSNNAPAIIQYNNSQATPYQSTYLNSQFVYTSSTVNTVAPLTKACVRYNNSSSLSSHSFIGCVFVAEGARNGSPNTYYVITKSGSAAVSIVIANNITGGTANRIDAAITHSSYIPLT
jgi:hypothetical protein